MTKFKRRYDCCSAITTATIIASFKFVFPQFTSSLYVSFLSRVKMNSTNWPAPNAWVFVAQLVRALQRLQYYGTRTRQVIHGLFNAETMGSSPVEVPKFLCFGLICNCLNCNYCTATIIFSFKFVFLQFTSSF